VWYSLTAIVDDVMECVEVKGIVTEEEEEDGSK
jgi:hypothetical protein